MAITVVNDFFGSVEASDTLALTHGFTLAADDLIVAMCHMNNNGVTVSTPHTGFANVETKNTGASGGASLAVYTKTTNGTEDADITFVMSSSTRISITLLQLRGATALENDVFPMSSSAEETSSSTTECPDITVADNSMHIAWHLIDSNTDGTVRSSITSGWTLGASEGTTQQIQDYGYKAFTTGAAAGQVVHTRNSSQPAHTGHSFSFKESAAGGTNTDILVPTGPLR